MSQKGEAPPWAMGLQKAPKTPGKLFPVPAVNPQPSSILAQNPGVLDQKTPPCSQSCPNPRCLCPFSPNRVQCHGFRVGFWGGMGGKGNFLPFFFPPSPLVLAESFQPGGQLPDELQLRVIHLFGAILSGSKVFLGWGQGQRGHGGVPTALPNPHCPPYGVGYIGTGWGEGNQDPAPSLSCSKQDSGLELSRN